MNTYTTTQAELGGIADAIRNKGGTTAQLVYPIGFIDAIDAIANDTTAVASDICIGKTAYAGGVKITGSLQKKSVSDIEISDDVVTIPAGLYTEAASVRVTSAMLGSGDTFEITVPNGQNSYITFHFVVDASGNTTIT